MAIFTPIMPVGARKAPALSGLALAFSTFLHSFEAFIEAEQDLEQVDGFDPAFAHWLRDAEVAQEQMTSALCSVRQLAPLNALDLPFLRMAAYIDLMIGTDDPVAFRNLHSGLPSRMMPYFQLPGKTPEIRHCNLLLARASVLIDQMAALPLFARDVAEIPEADAPVSDLVLVA